MSFGTDFYNNSCSDLNNNLITNNLRRTLWTGSITSGTINLSDSAHNYRYLIFSNATDGIRAILPIVADDLSTIRCSGMTPTSNDNFGSFGVYGSISEDGMSLSITKSYYITHGAGTNHSEVSQRVINRVTGFK